MKKFFNHTKRPVDEWAGYEEEDYIWEDGESAGEEVGTEEIEDYADEIVYEDDAAYAEGEGDYTDEIVYEDDAAYAEGEEEYADEIVYEDDAAYAEGEGDYTDEIVYEDDAAYAEGEGDYTDEIVYEDDAAYAEGEEGYTGEIVYMEDADGNALDNGVIYYEDDSLYDVDYEEEENYEEEPEEGGLWAKLRGMTAIDGMIMVTGAAVVILALIMGGMFISARVVQEQVSDFVSVGAQLENISVIGEAGLLAVADAQISKASASVMVDEELSEENDENEEYEENDYSRQVTVALNMTSIQKDLKIKFINHKTGKLIANVPFSVTVKDPDGKTIIWSDDDMDGIIYKKDITPGTYEVAMEALTDEKYDKYLISTDKMTVSVKKDISYQKVDVANEVKSENEIDAKKEDTAKNEVVVESVLQDTVTWVESKVIGDVYSEVMKDTIPNPLTLASVSKSFIRVDTQAVISPATLELEIGKTGSLTAGYTPTPAEGEEVSITDIVWSSDNGAVATVDNNGTVTAVAEGTATITYTAKVTYMVQKEEPTPSPDPGEEPTPSPDPGEEPTPSPGSGEEPTPSPGSDEESTPAPEPETTAAMEVSSQSASPDMDEASGSARESAAGSASAGIPAPMSLEVTREETISGTCIVTVVPKALNQGTLTIDKKSISTVVKGTVTLQATAENFTASRELVYTAKSDKKEVATAEVDQTGRLTITGIAAGTARITVSVNYKDGAAETEASVDIDVTVGANKVIVLEKTYTAYVKNLIEVKATINNTFSPTVTVTSSDTNVLKVTLGTLKTENGVTTAPITLEGVKEGSVKLTVKCVENGEEVQAECVITVKPNPKEDVKTELKDKNGAQVYVFENNEYRKACYADYYKFEKFYVATGQKYTGWQTIDNRVYFFTANGDKVTGEQVIQGAKYNFGSDGALINGNGLLGIDVSKWNGTIDWTAVKNSGINYVIIRCGYRGSSQGKLVEDPKFVSNIKGATAAGLKVGVYFFTQAVDEREAVEEASMVLDQIKNYRISYPVFLDVESSGGRADSISKETRTAVCKAFCQTIQNANYTAGIYANKNWFENKINASELSAYKIWLAQYASAPTYTGRYDLWQYRSTGKVTGISGNVDLNLSYMGY